MRKFNLLLAFGLVVGHCFTQGVAQVPATLKTIQPKVDSLTALLGYAQGKDRYVVLRDIAYEYYDIDNERGLEFIKQANTLAIQLGDSMDIVHSTRMLGQLLRRTGRTSEGIKALLSAFDLAKKIKFEKEELRIAGSLGVAYLRGARFDSSLRFTYYALRMRMKRGEHEEAGHLWGNIGLLYYKLGHFEEAIRYYQKAAEAYSTAEVSWPVYLTTNIALCQMRMGQHIEARITLDQWKAACLKGTCSAFDSLQWIFAEGLLHNLEGRVQQSKPWFYETLRRADAIGDGPEEIGARVCIARCLLAENDLKKARFWLEQARDLAVSGGDDFVLIDIYDYLIVISRKEGITNSLYLLMDKRLETMKRVFNEKVLHTVAVARVEFEEYENQVLIEKQEEVLKLSVEAIARHRLLIVSSTGLVIVLLMLVIVLVRFYRFQKSVSLDLDKRVFDRTRELEASEKALMTTVGEQKSLMYLLSSRLRASVATVTGLRNVVSLSDPDLARTVDGFDSVASELQQLCRFIDLARDAELENTRLNTARSHLNGRARQQMES